MKFRTEDIMPPPIVKISEAAKRYVNSPEFLNLGQGLPGHIPPMSALSSISDNLKHPSLHRYTPDQGHLELREELSIYLRQISNINVNPQDELVITAGANSGLAGAILTLVGQGDNVIMPTPFYFNAAMAVRLAGGEVQETPVDNRFQPNPDHIAELVNEKTRAIIMVSPNNPTGAVYHRDVVDKIIDICIDHDILLISDETYAQLVFDGHDHYSPWSRTDAHNNVVSVASFSKDFGMSGWRVGYIFGSSEFIQEYLKVQDTITICAPTAGQLLALEILKHNLNEIEKEIFRLETLRELAYMRAREVDALEFYKTSGTFYMFPKVKDCKDTRKLVFDLLSATQTLVLPGGIFGPRGEGHIRLSIGPLTPDAVDEAFNRLVSFFERR
jgi:aminotransferase